MPKYLIQTSYTTEGVTGLAKEGGSGRRKAVEATVKSLGGRVESFYFAFGEADAYIIVDLPDHATASALAMAVNRAGAAHTKTIVLMTPEEIDAATKKIVEYRPPGR